MSPQFLMRLIARIMLVLTVPFVRYEYRGGACLRDHDGWIMSANHRSVFDFVHAVVALHHYRWYARIMIAAEFWSQPHFAWGVKAIDAIPIYRKSDPKGSLSAVEAALSDGASVCIMPEGGLHWDPDNPLEMGPVRTGVARLAEATGVPVLPIALVGGERVWPKGARLPRFWRRHVVVCRLTDEPLWLDGDDPRADAERVRQATQALIRQATADLQALDPSYLPELDVTAG